MLSRMTNSDNGPEVFGMPLEGEYEHLNVAEGFQRLDSAAMLGHLLENCD